MEKQRNFTISKSCKRLLIFVFFAIFLQSSIFSQKLSKSQLKNLRILPAESQKLYSKEEIKFEVILPGISANQIQIQNPSSIKNVTFNTLRKTEVYSDKISTKIELWLTFAQKGIYNLPELSILLNGKKTDLKFEQIVIDDNPVNKSSRIVIKFDNGKTVYSDDNFSQKVLFSTEAGKKLNYTIFLQYAVQLIEFDWDLPKDSILTQTKIYEITEIKYREKKYTDELIPVASFEWTQLSTGKHSMPEVRIIATDYNGYRNILSTQNFLINFTNQTFTENSKADSLFVEAFNSNYIHSEEKTERIISDEDCEKLAKLRSLERKSFFSSARQNRENFEKELNLPEARNEYPILCFYFSILILILSIFLVIIFIKKRKSIAQIFAGIFLLCSIIFFIFSSIRIFQKFAILKNGIMYSIPEENASSMSELSPATRVKILKQTENWTYVEIGETGGWIKNENLCFIY